MLAAGLELHSPRELGRDSRRLRLDRGLVLAAGGQGRVRDIRRANSIPPPRADFVDAYRAAYGEEPTDYAAAAYACVQVILASLEAVAEDGPDADGLREALRARAVDPAHQYETVIGTVGFDANGDSTKQLVSFFRVDPEVADGAGDWALVKQQDFGPPEQPLRRRGRTRWASTD